MKKVMFALCFMFGGIVIVSAQETQDTTSNQYRTEEKSQYPQDPSAQDQPGQMMGQDQDRQRIQSTELPDAVKRSLEAQEYRGWLVNGAFKATATDDQSGMPSDTTGAATREPGINATGAQGAEIYIVELKNGAQTQTVRFDSEGNKFEGEGMENEGQDPNNQYNQNDPNQTDPNQTDPNQIDQSDPNSGNQADPNDQSDQQQPGSQPDAPTPDSESDEVTPE